MPFVHLTGEMAQRARHGAIINLDRFPPGLSHEENVRIEDEKGSLIGIGVYDAEKKSLHPRILLAQEN